MSKRNVIIVSLVFLVMVMIGSLLFFNNVFMRNDTRLNNEIPLGDRECYSNADCGPGKKCNSGTCENNPSYSGGTECVSNSECSSGKRCYHLHCVPQCTDISDSSQCSSTGCYWDSSTGKCLKTQPASTPTPSSTNTPSPAGTPAATANAVPNVCCYTHGSYALMPKLACTASGGSEAGMNSCNATPMATPSVTSNPSQQQETKTENYKCYCGIRYCIWSDIAPGMPFTLQSGISSSGECDTLSENKFGNKFEKRQLGESCSLNSECISNYCNKGILGGKCEERSEIDNSKCYCNSNKTQCKWTDKAPGMPFTLQVGISSEEDCGKQKSNPSTTPSAQPTVIPTPSQQQETKTDNYKCYCGIRYCIWSDTAPGMPFTLQLGISSEGDCDTISEQKFGNKFEKRQLGESCSLNSECISNYCNKGILGGKCEEKSEIDNSKCYCNSNKTQCKWTDKAPGMPFTLQVGISSEGDCNALIRGNDNAHFYIYSDNTTYSSNVPDDCQYVEGILVTPEASENSSNRVCQYTVSDDTSKCNGSDTCYRVVEYVKEKNDSNSTLKMAIFIALSGIIVVSVVYAYITYVRKK